MKRKRFKFITAVVLSLVLVFTMAPGAVFAADDITVNLTVKNNTFTKPLINDAGLSKTPKWTGTLLENYKLKVKEDQSLAEAMLSCGAIDIVDNSSEWGSYFVGFNGLKSGLGIAHESWGAVYDTTGWVFSVNGTSAMAGPSDFINTTSAISTKLNDGDAIDYSYTVDGSDTDNAYLPGTPTKLTAKATAFNTISLSWTAAGRAQGYIIKRADSFNGEYKKIGIAAANTYQDKTAVPGKEYYYSVMAARSANLQNTGDSSNLVKASTTLGKPSIKVAKKGKKALKVSWKKVDGAKYYQIYRATKSNGKYKKVKTVAANKLSYTNKKLKSGKKYYYKVRALTKVDGKNITGDFSAKKSAKAK